MGNKKILDPCCGSKMFWFDKNNPDVEFCDIRELPKTEYYPGKYIEINPDTICDFTDLPFEDNSFYLVVFDPPHLQWAGDKSIMALKYGKLTGDWKSILSAGFDECMRVLKPNGVLIFKWSEIQFSLSEILPLFSQKPLFGNKCRKRGNKTHWLCFMRINTFTKDKIILFTKDETALLPEIPMIRKLNIEVVIVCVNEKTQIQNPGIPMP